MQNERFGKKYKFLNHTIIFSQMLVEILCALNPSWEQKIFKLNCLNKIGMSINKCNMILNSLKQKSKICINKRNRF